MTQFFIINLASCFVTCLLAVTMIWLSPACFYFMIYVLASITSYLQCTFCVCWLLVPLFNRLQLPASWLNFKLPVHAVFWSVSWGMSSTLRLASSMPLFAIVLLQGYLQLLYTMWGWSQVCHPSPVRRLWAAQSLGFRACQHLQLAPQQLLLSDCPLLFSPCQRSWLLKSRAYNLLICGNFCQITWAYSRILRNWTRRCWQLQFLRHPGPNSGKFTTCWRGCPVLQPIWLYWQMLIRVWFSNGLHIQRLLFVKLGETGGTVGDRAMLYSARMLLLTRT